MNYKLLYVFALFAVVVLWSCNKDNPIVKGANRTGVAPAAASVEPHAGVRAGQIITIAGSNLDTFHLRAVRIGDKEAHPDLTVAIVEIDSFFDVTSSQVKFRLPIAAPDGPVFLVAKDDALPNVATGVDMDVIKPTIDNVTPARADGVKGGDTVTFYGTNLDLIRNVEIGGMRLNAPTTSNDSTVLKAVCPPEIVGGALKIICYNGYTVQLEGGQFENVAEKMKITAVAPEDLDPMALSDSTLTVAGEHLDAVVQAFIDDYELRIDQRTAANLVLVYRSDVPEGTLKLVTGNGTELKHINNIVYKPIAPTFTAPSLNVGVFAGAYYHVHGTYLNSIVKIALGGSNILSQNFSDAGHTYFRATIPSTMNAGTYNNAQINAHYAATGDVFATPISVKVSAPIDMQYTVFDFDGNPGTVQGTEDIFQSTDGSKFGVVQDDTMHLTTRAYYTRTNNPPIAGLTGAGFVFNGSTFSFAVSVDKDVTTADADLRWNIEVRGRDTLVRPSTGQRDSSVTLVYNFSAVWAPNTVFDVDGGWVRVDLPLNTFELYQALTTSQGTIPAGTPMTEYDLKNRTFAGITLRTAGTPNAGTKVKLLLDNVAFVSGP
ncbi:hypothetical protein AGMMS4956_11780 [Bacteroidia bacterium]|nr:hypothetical protein AGMMS4956_11780 [Bacteroidia bacterium]